MKAGSWVEPFWRAGRALVHGSALKRLPVVAALVLAVTPSVLVSAAESHTTERRPVQGGTSAGNINHFEKRSCLGGTLGAFLKDQSGALYGLSNNHVFARTNAAQAGELIVQPGLIDVGCQKLTEDGIGTLLPYVLLNFGNSRRPGQNQVDAAMARMTAPVQGIGEVLEIGAPGGNIVDTGVLVGGGLVKKSGRTSGLTRGEILAYPATIVVNYGNGRYARFDNQITVTPGSFLLGGDSGSVMFEDRASSPRAIGLLYAGSSSIAIASPMGLVLAALNQRNPGLGLTMVGSGGLGPSDLLPQSQPAQAGAQTASEPARAAKRQNEDRLLQLPDVVGVGVGQGGVLHVYLQNENAETRRQVPPALNNAPVRVIVTGEITAR